ncbi:MAG: hypothetical protein IK013_08445 [Bacteroidales bacterium]|nr:hypothetical protein [Bacteroidales bacterium]
MNKQDIIRFVVNCKLDQVKSVMVLIADDKRVCPFIEGEMSTLAAAMVLTAKQNPEFKEVMEGALSYLDKEGGEE